MINDIRKYQLDFNAKSKQTSFHVGGRLERMKGTNPLDKKEKMVNKKLKMNKIVATHMQLRTIIT